MSITGYGVLKAWAGWCAWCMGMVSPPLGHGTVLSAPGDTVVRAIDLRRPPTPRPTTERLSIGSVDGPAEYTFAALASVAIGRDGRVMVLDAPFVGRPILRLFDPRGQFLRQVGNVGNGPGEYVRPSAVAAFPDGRFLLLDHLERRLTVYSANGDYLSSWSIPHYHVILGYRNSLQISPNGTISIRFVLSRTTAGHETHAVARISSDGAVIDTLLVPSIAPIELVVRTTRAGSITAVPTEHLVPYSPRTFSLWSPLGYFITARSDRYALDLRLPHRRDGNELHPQWRTGDLVFSIRASASRVSVSRAERAEQRNFKLQQFRNMRVAPSGPIPDVPANKPFFRDVLVATDGRIWVLIHAPSERYQPPQVRLPSGRMAATVGWREEARADVFEPSGRYVGRVAMPADVSILVVHGNDLWGSARDELGVPFLKKFVVSW